MKRKRAIIFFFLTLAGLIILITGVMLFQPPVSHTHQYKIGQHIDSLNGVYVYYNGKTSNVSGRNTTANGYNLGLKYQCVEFVKRYYYEHLEHVMPDSYGHAKSFFLKGLGDGEINKQRDLLQFTNPSKTKPQINDLVVFDGYFFNRYGHVAIIAEVREDYIEIIQQNPGKGAESREKLRLMNVGGKWQVDNGRVPGWLRKDDKLNHNK